MSFAARFKGWCNAAECTHDGHIEAGDDVTYIDDELMHVGCASSQNDRYGPFCPECKLHHRGECW